MVGNRNILAHIQIESSLNSKVHFLVVYRKIRRPKLFQRAHHPEKQKKIVTSLVAFINPSLRSDNHIKDLTHFHNSCITSAVIEDSYQLRTLDMAKPRARNCGF